MKRIKHKGVQEFVETDEFDFEPCIFTLPFSNRLGMAAALTSVLVVVFGASWWGRASLVSPNAPTALLSMGALILGSFGVAYLILEKLETPKGRPKSRLRFSTAEVTIYRKGCRRSRSFGDLAIASRSEKELSLLFDDGELIVVPISAFRSHHDFDLAASFANPALECEVPLRLAA